MKAMLSRVYRFHSRGGVNWVYKNGRRFNRDNLSVIVVVGTGRKFSRFAVVVSKKVYKSAVKRNRIRRRIYEIIRLYISSTVLENTVDVMISVYSPEVLDLPEGSLADEVVGLLKQTGL